MMRRYFFALLLATLFVAAASSPSRAAEKFSAGGSCTGDNAAFDWDTFWQCSGGTWHQGAGIYTSYGNLYYNGEGGVLNLKGNDGSNYFLENLNSRLRGVNSPWTAEIWNIDQSGHAWFNSTVSAATPVNAGDLATKAYVDANAGGAKPWHVQTFASNGTWTKPAGTTEASILAVGGGGGGGSSNNCGDSQSYGGGGGGGGLIIWSPNTPVTANLTVTIGGGGSAGHQGPGGNGGNTTVTGTGVSVTASGGFGGGVASQYGGSMVGGVGVGAGGIPSANPGGAMGGFAINTLFGSGIPGNGGVGYPYSNLQGGGGGGASFGNGGNGGQYSWGSGSNGNLGGGGGGSGVDSSCSYVSGGAGGSGYVIIQWQQ